MDDVAFTNEEKATIDALRLKYTRDDTRQPADVVDVLGIPPALASATVSADGVQVRLCAVCQGSGFQTEVYHHRRMQRTCEHCSGQGVLVSGGKAVAVPPNRKQVQQQSGKAQRAEKLQSQAAKYEQELQAVQKAAAASSGHEHDLQLALCHQLEMHVQRLRSALESTAA